MRCPTCQGSGRIGSTTCSTCGGSGKAYRVGYAWRSLGLPSSASGRPIQSNREEGWSSSIWQFVVFVIIVLIVLPAIFRD